MYRNFKQFFDTIIFQEGILPEMTYEYYVVMKILSKSIGGFFSIAYSFDQYILSRIFISF